MSGPDVIELLQSSKSTIIDSEFYNTFVDAEKKFQQLPDNVTRTEFITKIHKAINKLLSEPTKLLLKIASKSGTKRGLLQSEREDLTTKKKKTAGQYNKA